MKPGDLVTVMYGLDGRFVGEVVIPDGHLMRDPQGRVAVRPVNAAPGAWLRVPAELIDEGAVAPPSSPRHRAGDPETARLAAEAAAERLTEHQFAVLSALVEAGQAGLIDHEHEARNGLIPTSAGKRRLELERLGLVAATGRRRLTASHRWATVHQVTARGIAVHQHHIGRGAA